MTATLVPYDIVRQYYSTDGKIHWSARFVKEDFNDTSAAIFAAGLAPLWELGQLTLTSITTYLRSTTSGAGNTWIVNVRFGASGNSVKVQLFVTPASELNVERLDCNIILADELRGSTFEIVTVQDTTDPAVAHNADDCWVYLEGFATPRGPTVSVIPAAQPVSVEAYRWPLKRVK